MRAKRNPALVGRTKDGDKVKSSRLFEDYNKNVAEKQREMLLNHLNIHGCVSTLEAREMGILSPNSVVYRLRARGYRIKTVKVIEDGHRIAKYRFMTKEEIEAEGGKNGTASH